MLERITNHILEIEYDKPQSHKYKVMNEAYIKGYKIQFDVMYYSSLLLEEEIIEDIGNKEGELIR